MKPTNLNDTIELMRSDDYKDRFKAEYYQLKIRHEKLLAMRVKMDEGTLEFTPICPPSTYDLQLEYMEKYLAVLEARAAMEGVDLVLA